MEDPKTFGELSLHDKLFYVTRDFHSTIGILGMRADEDERGRTILSFTNSDFEDVSFPDGEDSYEDKDTEIKYTTNKKKYQEWIRPFIEIKITNKEKRIEEIKLEIKELRDSIV